MCVCSAINLLPSVLLDDWTFGTVIRRVWRATRGHVSHAKLYIYIAKLYVLHTKSTVPFVLACVYVRF